MDDAARFAEGKVRQTIRFLLGDEERTLHGVKPTTTVLDWLRACGGAAGGRATGSKEGCAEGDCGACTVVLGEPEGEGMRYRAVNACILFIPSLDGRQLLTVEHLRDADGTLHPVQQALVEHHGSQCGFCTPGFVMAMFALYHAQSVPGRLGVTDGLGGNLCRCTGYRPIVDAAMASCLGPAEDRFAASAAATAARLRAMGEEPLGLSHDGTHFLVPRTADQLAGLLHTWPDSVMVAGGTDVGLWVTKAHRALPGVIALDRVAELATVTEADGVLSIGACVVYEDALVALARHWPDFGRLVRRIGARQIRNRGTMGGNVVNASPIGDSAPALIALNATLVLRDGPDRRTLPAEDFFRGYRQTDLRRGEFLERIEIPLPSGEVFATYKVSKRFEQDISSVCAAFRLRLVDGRVDEIRIAYGGMAAIPKRAIATEQTLGGRLWNRATVAAGMAALEAELSPIGDARASAEYRKMVAGNLLLRFMLETAPEEMAQAKLPDLEEAA